MITEIKVLSRYTIDLVSRGHMQLPMENKKWNLISVHEGDCLSAEQVDSLTSQGCEKILSLFFHDITEKINNRYQGKFILFSDCHCIPIIKFIDDLKKSKEATTLVIHCHAGISRSGAIGTFACDYCNLDYQKFINEHETIYSNPYVLRLLRDKARVQADLTHDGINHNYKGIICI
jgi:predicted protein tyrosine phosphatase